MASDQPAPAAPQAAPPPAGPPQVDFTLQQARRRVARNIGGFLLIVLVVLGVTFWLVLRNEPEGGEEAVETATATQAVAAATSPARTAAPAMFSDSLDLAPDTPAPRMDSEKMAQAYAEVRLANQQLRAGDLDQAETHAFKALELWPDIQAARRLLGIIFTQSGQFDQAQAMLEHALNKDPFSVDVMNNLATVYMQKHMNDKAEELLQLALQMQPEYYYAQLNLGLLYLLSQRYELAADHLSTALERNPNVPSSRNNLAVALLRLNRMPEARAQLQQIIDLAPEYAAAYFNMAITYALEGQVAEALAWIKRGAGHCTPAICQKYLADPDFNAVRTEPEFQELVRGLYPQMTIPAAKP